jgi:hypothetical protein
MLVLQRAQLAAASAPTVEQPKIIAMHSFFFLHKLLKAPQEDGAYRAGPDEASRILNLTTNVKNLSTGVEFAVRWRSK